MGVSPSLLHRYDILCIDDLVTINNNLMGIIIDINDDNYTVKDMNGDVSIYNRQQIKLATSVEIEDNLKRLLHE